MSDVNDLNMDDQELSDDAVLQREADEVYAELLARVGESNPNPRLDATRRAVELLGDVHRAAPVIHLTGTNGKTSTSRMIDSLLRASGVRTGMMTSPHLVRINERIMIDGSPISNEALIAGWRDITPYLAMVDAELGAEGQLPLTFFEALTVLAFACFADAPVDVVVLEVGMGGLWDSTNVADGQVAVFTPIALDHVARLGSTVAEIAATKAGIIKDGAHVVTAAQTPDARAAIDRASAAHGAPIYAEGQGFSLTSTTVAVGGQLITVAGRAGEYKDVFLPLFGDHQAHNAAVAIAAVETFLGDASRALTDDVVAEGFATVTSPGRLEIISTDPTVLIDAAHNPQSASSLVEAVRRYFTFNEVALVLGVLEDKDVEQVVATVLPLATRVLVTQSASDRALPVDDLAYVVRGAGAADILYEHDTLSAALDAAREWAELAPGRAVIVTGSITLVGDALVVAETEGWKR